MNDIYTTLMITGWAFLLASWFPKPFITDEPKRRLLNIALAAISLSIFLSAGMTLAYINYYL
jgi:hypothetical protein